MKLKKFMPFSPWLLNSPVIGRLELVEQDFTLGTHGTFLLGRWPKSYRGRWGHDHRNVGFAGSLNPT